LLSISLRHFIIALIFLLIIITGAVFVFHFTEGFSYLDSLWLIIVSVSTVGYGDIVPHTVAGRITTMVVILSGVWLFAYVLGTFLASLIEGEIKQTWVRKKMLNTIARLADHIIVCGLGRVGTEIVAKLRHENVIFVIIEKNPEIAKTFQDQGLLCINGDATEDEILLTAGLRRARNVILALPDDGINLLVAVTCKDLNPNIRIISRATRLSSVKRLNRAGVDIAICPTAIGGTRMALNAWS